MPLGASATRLSRSISLSNSSYLEVAWLIYSSISQILSLTEFSLRLRPNISPKNYKSYSYFRYLLALRSSVSLIYLAKDLAISFSADFSWYSLAIFSFYLFFSTFLTCLASSKWFCRLLASSSKRSFSCYFFSSLKTRAASILLFYYRLSLFRLRFSPNLWINLTIITKNFTPIMTRVEYMNKLLLVW